jgi:1-acylglycerone phosphate reductase
VPQLNADFPELSCFELESLPSISFLLTMSPKTVLITGCSDNGIGSALGFEFHKRGYHVFATARNVSKMTWIKGLDNITPLELDVKKPSDIKNAVETVSKATDSKLDFLVNNAARNHFMPILDVEIDEVQDLFETNYFAPLAITQAFAPLLIKVFPHSHLYRTVTLTKYTP